MSMKIDRHTPLLAKIKERFLLTKEGSTKKTFHLVLDTSPSGIDFKVGDAVGICPRNDPLLVAHVISMLGATGNEIIQDKRSQKEYTLQEFLSSKANLARATSSFLKLFYSYEQDSSKKKTLEELLSSDNKEALSSYLDAHDPLDLFKEYRGAPLQEVCSQFGPLLPRFYSIASSPLLFPRELHLTVALFTYTHQGEMRYGVASHFLCSLAEPHATPIPIYIQANPHFTLPEDPTIPLILIGPGTGIAPFRAFIQERVHKGAPGDLWLFFGERNRATDYFYEEELESYRAQGKLALDLAFSRDQSQKVYVQHLMLQKSKQLWQWLQRGAILYVCGDADQMAKEVDAALHAIVEKEGQVDPKAYIKELRHQKRYLTDVY